MDKALYAVVMEAYTGGISTRKVAALVEALGGASGVSKSEVINCTIPPTRKSSSMTPTFTGV